MKSNEGTVDRLIRVLLGLAIIGVGLYYKNWLGMIGVIPLFTGIFGICLLYLPFGISTKKG